MTESSDIQEKPKSLKEFTCEAIGDALKEPLEKLLERKLKVICTGIDSNSTNSGEEQIRISISPIKKAGVW